MVEAVCAAAFGVLVAFLLMFVARPRLGHAGLGPRGVLFVGGAGRLRRSCRWRSTAGSGGNRRLEQLARLLGRKHPQVGDQLLGVIELVHNESEQARSRALCEAAIGRSPRTPSSATSATRCPTRGTGSGPGWRPCPLAAAVGLLALFPAAAANAWARLLAPWRDTPRYTFAALEPLPDRLVVAHGEPFAVTAELDATAPPGGRREGEVRLGDQHAGRRPAARRPLRRSSCRRRSTPAGSTSAIGDAAQRVRVEPTLAARADLGRRRRHAARLPRPARSRSRRTSAAGRSRWSRGARPRFAATASRELASAAGRRPAAQTPAGATVASPATHGRRLADDGVPLAGRVRPGRQGAVHAGDQRPRRRGARRSPARTCPGRRSCSTPSCSASRSRPRTISASSASAWNGRASTTRPCKTPAKGERILAAGGNDKDSLDVGGTFSAKSLGIEPQPVNVRVFAEDYLPGRPRVYSPTYTFYVLNAEQHAIWLTEQLSKWHRQSLEVRDREMQLYETNKQLRALAAEELDRPETRRRIENQADGRAGQRPAALGPGRSTGEDLVQQAMRNPEFGVGHLEKWAEMLQILKDISGNRMPSVADLLKQAAQAPSAGRERRRATRRRWPGRSAPPAPGAAGRAEAENGQAAGGPAGRRPRVVAAAAETRTSQAPPSAASRSRRG